jgi:hypothetical protein
MAIITLAGKDVGEPADYIVRWDDDNKKIISKQRIAGRNIYIKKCKRKLELEFDGGKLYMPDTVRDNNTFGLVLAISRDCGKWNEVTKAKRKLVDMKPHVEFLVNVGERIMTRDDHPYGIHASSVPGEYFIHECAVIAVI